MLFSVLLIKFTAPPPPGSSSRVGCNLSIRNRLRHSIATHLFYPLLSILLLPLHHINPSHSSISSSVFLKGIFLECVHQKLPLSLYCFYPLLPIWLPPLHHINPSHSSISSRVFLEGIFLECLHQKLYLSFYCFYPLLPTLLPPLHHIYLNSFLLQYAPKTHLPHSNQS